MLPRPGDLFDREQDWAELSSFVTDSAPGLRIGVVYGRRRQGKSYLLRRLARETGGFYHQALEHEPTQALSELGDRLGSHLGVGRLALGSWEEAIASLRQLAPRIGGGIGGAPIGATEIGSGSMSVGPAVAILDEFPYLLERSPELPSILQRAVDLSKDEGWPAVRLVLCGSAISVMADLLKGQGALRGRIHTNLLVRPFNHLDSSQFWEVSNPQLALRVNAILGGTPGYRELIPSAPSSLAELDAWIVDEVLSPSSAFFREDEWLLGEQREMEDRAVYLSVLSAVAGGSSSQTEIAGKLGRSQQSVLHPLDALVRSGFLAKDDDVIRKRRPVYRIADPVIRFHQVVRQPRTALFEDHRGGEAWNEAKPSFSSLVLGPHFEQMAREHVLQNGETILGERPFAVGTTVVSDKLKRATAEIDIVALSQGTGPQHRPVAAIGEAKLRELNADDLSRLENIRTLIPGAEAAKILLVSATGFDNNLVTQIRDKPNVHLIRLEDIFHTMA